MRPIDHLVLPVTTLTLARSRLNALGFTVAPDARHPFGTGNSCVLFRDRTFLEPITVLDRHIADVAAAEGNFFVTRLKRYTERRGEGFAMVALRSEDAAADAAAFRRAGLESGAPFRFTRTATSADGSEREIGFALAQAGFPAAKEVTFFGCQHLGTDALFETALTEHANGASGISAVAAVAETPADFDKLLSDATGAPELRTTPFGVEAVLANQKVLVLTPEGFRVRYGAEPPAPREGILFAAFELVVEDLERPAGVLGAAGKRNEDMIVVAASPGLGAVAAFRTPPNA